MIKEFYVVHNEGDEKAILTVLQLFGYKWADGDDPTSWIPSRHGSHWRGFPYLLTIGKEGLTWERMR